MRKTPEPARVEKGMDDGYRLVGIAYGCDPADGHAHQWVRGSEGDFCLTCRISWPDAMRGFGSNVAPPKQMRR